MLCPHPPFLEVDYNASGQVIASNDPAAVDTVFGYTGRFWDSDINLQYNRARWYDPQTGRWLSQDPIGFAAGDANLYRYVGNGPTNWVDPQGESRFSGNYRVKGTDHHIVPVSLWERFGFADEAKEVFDKALLAASEHGRIGHGERSGYTAHVQLELEIKLKDFLDRFGEDGKLTVCDQKQFAQEFVEHIRTVENEYIQGFNQRVNNKADLETWLKDRGKKIDAPKLVGPSSVKIKGIKPGSVRVPPGVKFGAIGAKAIKIFAFMSALEVYNTARARGMSPENAIAFAGLEAVNPVPVGAKEFLEAGYAYTDYVDRMMEINRTRMGRVLSVQDPKCDRIPGVAVPLRD